jgi:hypothetical protein
MVMSAKMWCNIGRKFFCLLWRNIRHGWLSGQRIQMVISHTLSNTEGRQEGNYSLLSRWVLLCSKWIWVICMVCDYSVDISGNLVFLLGYSMAKLFCRRKAEDALCMFLNILIQKQATLCTLKTAKSRMKPARLFILDPMEMHGGIWTRCLFKENMQLRCLRNNFLAVSLFSLMISHLLTDCWDQMCSNHSQWIEGMVASNRNSAIPSFLNPTLTQNFEARCRRWHLMMGHQNDLKLSLQSMALMSKSLWKMSAAYLQDWEYRLLHGLPPESSRRLCKPGVCVFFCPSFTANWTLLKWCMNFLLHLAT